MTFPIPTLQELINRNEADIAAKLTGVDPRLRRSVSQVLAYINAGAAKGLYKYIEWISKQAFPDTAEAEQLDRWGSIWGVERRPATKAQGLAQATGNEGTLIPLATILQRSDGVQFVTLAGETISGGIATLSLEAIDFGVEPNTAPSSVLSFVSPIAGINSDILVDFSGLTGGADTEDDESYLSAILRRIQETPQGGAEIDYIDWTFEALTGVTRVWILAAGSVTVYFMMDNTYFDGIPQPGDVTAVADYIDVVRPVAAPVFVIAPIAQPLNFTIELNVADTVEIRAAVEQELKDMLLRDASPGGTIFLSRINEAISVAEGEVDHILISPVANVVTARPNISTFGVITWV